MTVSKERIKGDDLIPTHGPADNQRRKQSIIKAAQGSLPLTLNRKTMVGQPHRLLQWKKVITQQTFSGDCFCRRLLQTEANRAS